MNRRKNLKKWQAGVILLFCLVLLASLSLLVASALESILLHERAAANMDRFRASFALAEAALRDAEGEIALQCPALVGAATRSIWPQQLEADATWWNSNGVASEIEFARLFVESWRQAQEDLNTSGGFEVEGDAALVEVVAQEGRTDLALLRVTDGGLRGPGGVAAAGALDFDHIGAEACHQLRRKGQCGHLLGCKHPDAFERFGFTRESGVGDLAESHGTRRPALIARLFRTMLMCRVAMMQSPAPSHT